MNLNKSNIHRNKKAGKITINGVLALIIKDEEKVVKIDQIKTLENLREKTLGLVDKGLLFLNHLLYINKSASRGVAISYDGECKVVTAISYNKFLVIWLLTFLPRITLGSRFTAVIIGAPPSLHQTALRFGS